MYPDPREIAKATDAVEAVIGADMDGDGTVAGERLDFVTQLERVAALHAQGRLSDAEFQNLKARILG